jgi:hypothetical protein
MTVVKPYYRTARQFADGTYSEGGRSLYPSSFLCR